jgi:hypothetical protein
MILVSISESVYFAVRIPRYGNQWWSLRSQRWLTEVLLLGVFGDEVPALCHLLNQKLDSLDVLFDCLQGLCIMNEC